MAFYQYRILRRHVSLHRKCTVVVCAANRDRHVQKTDSIKDLVITEESSIAKGIRRVVAVTGHEAHDISRQANEFERRLTRIEGLQGKEKDAEMKPYLTVSCPPLLLLRYGDGQLTPSSGTWPERHLPDPQEPA